MLLVAAAALAAASWSAHWWTHPAVFDARGPGGSFVMNPKPLDAWPAGFSLLGGTPHFADETVVLRDVRGTWERNDTGASLEFAVCSPSDDWVGALAWFGPVTQPDGDLAQYCAELRPVRVGTRLDLRDEVLVYLVTPAREGVSRLSHVDVDYRRDARHLFQQGTQRIEERSTVRVGPTNQ